MAVVAHGVVEAKAAVVAAAKAVGVVLQVVFVVAAVVVVVVLINFPRDDTDAVFPVQFCSLTSRINSNDSSISRH